jgi:peptidoglycan/xylan/chitin deacetylase (PgdA/CDA1 family)
MCQEFNRAPLWLGRRAFGGNVRLIQTELRLPLLLFLAACSSDGAAPDTTAGGSSNAAGTSSVGGMTASAGSGGNPQAGVSGTASMTGGTPAAGGATTGGAGAGSGGTMATAGSTAGGAGAGGASGGAGGGGGSMTSGPSKMPVPPGAADLPKPSGTPGDITVLNWAGFKAAVSYSFDDSNSTQIQHYADLNALGVRFTFYMWTGKSDAMNSIWQTAIKDGHEIGNHTKSHSSDGTTADINAATDFIKQTFKVEPYTMAAPNGAGVYTNLAKPLFLINRGVGNGLIAPNDSSDPWTLQTFIPPTGATTAQFNQQVDDARTAGKWRTMCIHGFQGGNDGAYQPVPFDQFVASVQHAKSAGDIWIDSIVNVGAYWRGQKAFSQATSMTSGSDKTWTWKLPDHFPPGHYLRVKVDGGALKQNGQALPWDGHGYYEVALDAGSVTLSP